MIDKFEGEEQTLERYQTHMTLLKTFRENEGITWNDYLDLDQAKESPKVRGGGGGGGEASNTHVACDCM